MERIVFYDVYERAVAGNSPFKFFFFIVLSESFYITIYQIEFLNDTYHY